MSSRHGAGWETKPNVGFTEEEIRVLEQRRKDESYKPSNQAVSTRLLDFAHILDLKRIINNKWPDFAAIFQSRETTMFLLRYPE
jgi:hypothetical protein